MLIELKIIIVFLYALIFKILFTKIFKFKNKKIDYLIFILTFIFFLNFYKFYSVEQILYSLFLYCISVCSFFFLIISPIEGSPSLIILNKIYKNNSYYDKEKLFRYLISTRFIENRIKTLKQKKYIFINKKNLIYKKKNYLLFKIFYILNKIQKNTDNG
jgi:hypothetical protein